MSMRVRQTGQPLSMVATVAAQAPQNRECPHGTNATPSRGAIKHTTQVSPTDCAEVTVVLSDACYCRRRLVGLLLLFIVALVISDLHCYVKGVRMSPIGCGLWPSETDGEVARF